MEVSNPNASVPPEGLGIAAVERETGLGKDTLRVWERRYGFPLPTRDQFGERVYPPDQVESLRRIKRLMDLGMRPGKILAASEAEREAWLAAATPSLPAARIEDPGLLDLIRLHHSDTLRSRLQQHLLRQGLSRFVLDTVAPLNTAVGEAWMRGQIDIAEEHIYTEHVQNIIRSAVSQRGEPGAPPRVLLTTLPEELHALGILMVEALLVSEGVSCLSLGARTPPGELHSLLASGQFDVLALSFSAAFPHKHAVASLQALAVGLPAGVEIWAGGSGVALRMPSIPGVRYLGPLESLLTALQDWRQAHRS